MEDVIYSWGLISDFQWDKMAQGLKSGPQIYQRMMDNAVWGFVKPKEGWKHIKPDTDLCVKEPVLIQEASESPQEAEIQEPEVAVESVNKTVQLKSIANQANQTESSEEEKGDIFSTGTIDDELQDSVFLRRSYIDDISIGAAN